MQIDKSGTFTLNVQTHKDITITAGPLATVVIESPDPLHFINKQKSIVLPPLHTVRLKLEMYDWVISSVLTAFGRTGNIISKDNDYTASQVAYVSTDGIKNVQQAIDAINKKKPTAKTLAETLVTGNLTGGTDIEISTGDNIIVDDATILTITAFDAAKQITSLPLATYPSLAELANVKGVTSAIQTQINTKGSGTVTSVAAITLGTTGTDLSSTVANGTTTPVITLQVPTASASNRGALSPTDWSTFNNKITGTASSLTKTDDTNVTLTLGGTPTTALLQATSLTLGWTGVLAAARGGADAWVDYSATSTIVGWSSFTDKSIRYQKFYNGYIVTWYLGGTSNSTSVTFTLPAIMTASFPQLRMTFNGLDNGASIEGRYFLNGGASTITANATIGGGAWTGSGTKVFCGESFFEI